MIHIVYRQVNGRKSGLASLLTEPLAVVPGDRLPGSRRWIADSKTGRLRPHLKDSLTSGFAYVDEHGELYEERTIGLRRRFYAVRRRARLAFKDNRVFMLTVSNLGSDADAVRAYVLRSLAPLRALGAHWLHVVEEHSASDDFHTHVLIHAPRDSGVTRHTIRSLALSGLTSVRSTVKVDEAATRDRAEALAHYVAKTLLEDADGTLARNTSADAQRNSAFTHTRGFWGVRDWRAIYRNNLAAYYDRNRSAIRARELLEDMAANAIRIRQVSAHTSFTTTLTFAHLQIPSVVRFWLWTEECSANSRHCRRAGSHMPRAPPSCSPGSRSAAPPHPRRSLS